MSQQFMGYEGFLWFFGQVEDIADPLMLGRVRVRPFTEYNGLATEELPWARVLVPSTSSSKLGVGVTPLGLEVNSYVFGFYADNEQMQYPVILGSVHAIPQNEDGEYDTNNSDVSALARGINTIEKKLMPYEPKTRYGAVYPHNKVMETSSGHVIEIDDTPGAERLHIYHKSGTYVELSEDGQAVYKSVGNAYQITAKDHTMSIGGNVKIDVWGNTEIITAGTTNITSTQQTNIHSEGSTNVTSAGDTTVSAQGKTLVNSRGSTVVTSDAATTVRGSSVAVQGTTVAVSATSIKLQASSVKIQSGGIGFSSKPSIGGLGGSVSAAQDSTEVAKALGYNQLDTLKDSTQTLSAFAPVESLTESFDAVFTETPLKSLSDATDMVSNAVENIQIFETIGDLGALTLEMTEFVEDALNNDIVLRAQEVIATIDQIVQNGFPSLNDFNDVLDTIERGFGSLENITKMAKIGELLNTVAYVSDVYNTVADLAEGGITAEDFKNLIGITSGDLADFIDDIATGEYLLERMVDDFSSLELGLGGINDLYSVSGYLNTLADDYAALKDIIPSS